MQNEFEKQVKQKMEELKLVPSDPVWQKVEKQIRQKREKRRFLFFLFPFCLLTGIAIMWAISRNSNRILQNEQKKFSTIAIPSEKAVKQKAAEQKIQEQKPVKNLKKIIEKKGKSLTGKNNGSFLAERKNKINYSKQSSLPVSKNASAINIQFLKKNIDEPAIEKNKETVFIPKISSSGKEIMMVQKQIANPVNDSAANNKNNKENKLPDGKTASDSTVKQKIAKSRKKWEKSINFQAGWSSYRQGLFSNAKAADAFPSSLNSAGGTQTFYNVKKVSGGLSFAIGAEFKKHIGKRSFIGIGIQYHFYSTHILVGQQKQQDTTLSYNSSAVAVSTYYTNNGVNDYTNKYGMVEIPVSFSYQFLKKLPLHLSVGAAYGRLLKSNALTFNYASNVYYYNKENNIKNFISIFSSLQYRIVAKNKMKIKTGPVLQFTSSELQKENRYRIPHLFFWGLKTDINF